MLIQKSKLDRKKMYNNVVDHLQNDVNEFQKSDKNYLEKNNFENFNNSNIENNCIKCDSSSCSRVFGSSYIYDEQDLHKTDNNLADNVHNTVNEFYEKSNRD